MTRVRTLAAIALAITFLAAPPETYAVKYIRPPDCYIIRPGSVSLTIGIQEGVLRHTVLYNRLANKNIYLEGEEFEIWLKARVLKASEFRVTGAEQDEQSITVRMSHPSEPLDVCIFYQADEKDFFIRKWLELKTRSNAEMFIDRIVLQSFRPWKKPRTFSGSGQPVYMGNTFFGVEYPLSENVVREDGFVMCSYLVGMNIDGSGFTSKKHVLGVAEQGRVQDRFMEYIEKIRARPAKPFLLYNTWYDLRHYTAAEVIESIRGFREKLNEPYGIKFDSVVLDSGWDNYFDCWKPGRRRFPQGFKPVSEEARKAGAELGLWMSPLGGYVWRQWARLIGTLGQGFEKSWQGFCIAGPKYHEWFKDRMISYVREDKVNYFKLDNLTTSCDNPRHGHRTGKYGQAGLTDAFIDILDAVRAEKSDVMMNITRGAWLSPWWLMHADVVWIGGMDFFYAGKGTKRQKAITYRDIIMHEKFREQKAQFPLNSIMTHGIIKGRKQLLGSRDESIRDFKDDCMMYFGRGVMMWELYLSPDKLSDDEWQALADTIKWARENQTVLAESRMVLGNPARNEVYGYWHEHEDRAMLFLRNPDDSPKTANLIWKDLLRDKESEVMIREVSYPGEVKLEYKTLSGGVVFSLKPFQTLVLELDVEAGSRAGSIDTAGLP